MSDLKVTIEIKVVENRFIMIWKYYSKNGERNFHFSNATRFYESRDLKIENSKGELIERAGDMSINPKKWEPIDTTISDSKPFVYTVDRVIEDIGGNEILLDLGSVSYILKKDTPYYFYLIYEDEQTEKIEIIF